MTERTILDMALEALRPFAEIADNYEQARLSTAEAYRDEEPPPLLDSHRVCVALGDLRRAAAAVEAIEKMKGDAAPPPPPGDMVRVPRVTVRQRDLETAVGLAWDNQPSRASCEALHRLEAALAAQESEKSEPVR